ncbi:kinase-like domain-containing protein [Lophiotrema nucula]|uniref:Kinase-like domain-containing protein n=1 Tax=Lophiotrema nucula TaxID=690887 RepID=A0A6A5Z3R8_9PLEO|nr:kinase-like domain-containing protein [Lophiotrema nucula]
MVEDISTGSVFRLYGSRTERKRVFENEIKIIRRLAPHHHVIRVFATYVSKREVGLILSPVAQGDLEILLQDVYDADAPTPDQRHTLDISFGCLATGLAFMHRQKVRHKDIKPRNILVHNGSMIFTDFGYSLDHALNDNSTTTGRPDTFTRRYCAPEVDDWGPRNSKSDVFSLGCVFSQVLEALRFQQPKVSPSTCFHEIIEEIQSDLIELNTQDLYWNVAGTTASMLSRKPRDRFSADYVVAWLRKNSGGLFCQTCKNSSESYYFDGPSSAPEDLATLEEDILAIWDFHDLRRYLIKRANAPLYA